LDTMPDGKETYFSPMIISLPESGPETIIFGSGGETVSGHLYLTTLVDLLDGDIQSAQVLASEENHGFIAPVLCTDMNGDSIPDIVGNSHAGTVFVLDGSNLRQIWQTRFEGVEVSNMPVAGHFTTLARKDLFCILSQGSFPENTGTIQLLIHGENGQVLHADTLGCFGFSSPILIQTDEDPFDEVMYCVNQYPNCGRLFTKNVTELRTADFQEQVSSTVLHSVEGKNLGVTPSIIDLDGDQQPDLVQVVMENFTSIYLQHGLSVLRSSPNFPPQHSPWGTYMGNRYTCEM
ncbi:MAG: hypothetical protein NWR72_03515, partial [Bacteroidia bacterium]|nr:hypothetical protein [Bacteroidia bacterium]